MSTRGLWGFQKDGVEKMTYNHYDSYPAGLGAAVVDFIQNCTLNELHTICERIILVDDAGPNPADDEYNLYASHITNEDDMLRARQEWFHLLRFAAGKPMLYKNPPEAESNAVLDVYDAMNGVVYTGPVLHMVDNKEFIYESLFCEHGYIINLDDGLLEYWCGFQKKQQKGSRYKADKRNWKPDHPGLEFWYPCHRYAVYCLNDIIIKKYSVTQLVNHMQFMADTHGIHVSDWATQAPEKLI